MLIARISDDEIKLRVGAEMKQAPLAINEPIRCGHPISCREQMLAQNGSQIAGSAGDNDMSWH